MKIATHTQFKNIFKKQMKSPSIYIFKKIEKYTKQNKVYLHKALKIICSYDLDN